MNDRIRELAEQAQNAYWADAQNFYESNYKDYMMAKFAELIVQECCEVAHCNFHVDGLTLGGILKQHFGVET